MNIPKGKQLGLTLVEILVALAISLLLLAGVTQIFLSSKQSYRTNEVLSQIQESGRFAIDMLARDLRMAGATGCEETDEIANVLNSPATNWWSDLSSGPLVGYAVGSAITGITSGSAVGNRVPADADGNGPDAVVILKSSGSEDYTIVSHTPTSAQFKLSGLHNLQDGDIVTVCDTENTSVFQITNSNSSNVTIVHNSGTGTPGNCTKGLGYPVVCDANGTAYQYGPDAVLVKFDPVAYYVGWGSAGNGSRSLYRVGLVTGTGTSVATSAVELVQDVENMRVLYGLDTDNDNAVDSYSAAAGVADWKTVRSVRLSVLLRSRDNNVATAPQTINFDTNGDGTAETLSLASGDRYLRQVFSSTIGIRNRLP